MQLQTYVSEPTESGKYQISKFNITQNCYVPIKGEIYSFETIAKERARELNEIESYDNKINSLSIDYDTWGIVDTIKTFNELKSRENLLTDIEKQLLSDSHKKITAWNIRVNEVGKSYENLKEKGITGKEPPFKYTLKILRE